MVKNASSDGGGGYYLYCMFPALLKSMRRKGSKYSFCIKKKKIRVGEEEINLYF